MDDAIVMKSFDGSPLQVSFITQVLAKVVLNEGGTLRIPKDEIYGMIRRDNEGVLMFDLDGDDILIIATKISDPTQ